MLRGCVIRGCVIRGFVHLQHAPHTYKGGVDEGVLIGVCHKRVCYKRVCYEWVCYEWVGCVHFLHLPRA